MNRSKPNKWGSHVMKVFLNKSNVILVLPLPLSCMKIISGRRSSSPTKYSVAVILITARITEKEVFIKVGFLAFKFLMKMICERKYNEKIKKACE